MPQDYMKFTELPQDYPYFRRVWASVVLSLLLAAFIPLILIGGGMYYYSSTLLKQKTLESLHLEVVNHKSAIDQFLSERAMDLRLIAEYLPLASLQDPVILRHVFQSLDKEAPYFSDIGIIDSQGQHLNYVGPYRLLSKNYRETPWFKEVMENGAFISDVFLGFRNIPHFVMAFKKVDEKKEWIIRATIDTSYFNDIVSKKHRIRNGDAYLINKDGLFQTKPSTAGELMASSGFEKTHRFEGVYRVEKGQQILMMIWQEQAPWLSVVQMNRNDVYRDIRQATHVGIIVFALGAILIVMTVLLTTHYLVSRLEYKRRSILLLDQQLRQFNKMALANEASLGYLREMSDILCNIDVVASWIQEVARSKNWVEIDNSIVQMKAEMSLGKDAIEKYKEFQRTSVSIISNCNLNKLMDDLLEIFSGNLRFNAIRIVRNYDDSLPTIRSDIAQLRQVLANVLLNAITAVDSNGEIILTTSKVKDVLMIQIADNGPGISEAYLEKIFDPLFSTTPIGSGLGLAICRSILDKLGGKIFTISGPREGATFVIELPVHFVPS